MVAIALGKSPPNASYWNRHSGVMANTQEEYVNLSQDVAAIILLMVWNSDLFLNKAR